jgi:hypothetical protein
MDIRYLLDENVNPVLRVELLKRAAGMIIWKVGDPGAPSRGTADPDILLWCEKNSFILVTNNRKSMQASEKPPGQQSPDSRYSRIKSGYEHWRYDRRAALDLGTFRRPRIP